MYTDDQLSEFYKNYRESLSSQYENAKNLLAQQRKNYQQSIMAGANKSGMLYSNFPERAKIQYDADTYEPNYRKLQTTYQTGLDTLRSNIAKYQNAIAELQANTENLNSMT